MEPTTAAAKKVTFLLQTSAVANETRASVSRAAGTEAAARTAAAVARRIGAALAARKM